MEYAKLGNTGMDVSRICLGCMGFGDADRWIHTWVLNEENSRPIIKHALELGINFFDTANVYSIGRSEEILGRALQDFANRDEVVDRHQGARPDARGTERRRALAQGDPERDRPQPAAARDGLRGPLHDPPLGLRNPDRGDDGGAARRGAGRQGPLHRRLRHVGVAVPEGAARRRAARVDALRLDAEPPQPPLPRGGAGDAAALPRGGDRGDPVQPARLRTA